MSPARIERTITRIAYQIFEDTRGSDQLLILGIHERGYHLAVMLADKLSEIYHTKIKVYQVRVKEYAQGSAPADQEVSDAARDSKVVIVDDVMYSGRTMFEAIRKITTDGRPEEIRLAALIDRGHRRYPVELRYLGLYSPTKLKEHVHCRFTDEGKPEGVWLMASLPETT